MSELEKLKTTLKLFSFDKEILVNELKTNPKYKKIYKAYLNGKGVKGKELRRTLTESCTRCCNASSLLFVFARTEEEAKDLIIDEYAGACGDCVATFLVNGGFEISHMGTPQKDSSIPLLIN